MAKYNPKRRLISAAMLIAFSAAVASAAVLTVTVVKEIKENHIAEDVAICSDSGALATVTEHAEEEDPLETEHINEALFAAGYLRHDIPMTIGDQLVLRSSSDWYGVPYSLCLGLIEGESNFNADNDDGKCYGLMSINRDYFPDNLESWEVIETGVKCLAGKLEQYNGDVAAALTAYNAGHDTGNRDYANFVISLAEVWAEKGVDEYGVIE